MRPIINDIHLSLNQNGQIDINLHNIGNKIKNMMGVQN